jgi:hypothetical protein
MPPTAATYPNSRKQTTPTSQASRCGCCAGSGYHYEICPDCGEGHLFKCLACGGTGVEDLPDDQPTSNLAAERRQVLRSVRNLLQACVARPRSGAWTGHPTAKACPVVSNPRSGGLEGQMLEPEGFPSRGKGSKGRASEATLGRVLVSSLVQRRITGFPKGASG